MTKKECAIVMAYTGIVMLSGEDFQIYHKYIEDIMGRPVWTHELANESVVEEIKEKSKYDFLKLCEKAKYNDLTTMHQEPKTKWIPVSERLPEDYETVIASVDHERVYSEARYSKEFGWKWAAKSSHDYWVDLDGVNAWMPLPKPYSEAEQ